MKPGMRIALAAALAAGIALATRADGLLLAGAILIGAAAHVAAGRGLVPLIRSLVPVALFAAAVVALQWLSGTAGYTLPMRTLAVFLLSTAAFRIVPWESAAGRLSPESRLYAVGLFLLFVRHFSAILIDESRRTFQARSLCVNRKFGRGSFTSLAGAVAAVFRRALARAERFYAAQSISGIV
jgi:hypothetical protein